MDREDVFKLIQNKNWHRLIEVFKDNKLLKIISSDAICQKIIKEHFIYELISGTSFKNDAAYQYYLEQFYALHKGKNFDFTLDFEEFEKLVLKIVEDYMEMNKLKDAYNYAQEFPNNPECKKIIENFKKTKPQVINHSNSNRITITQNNEIENVDYTISLFKSNQEYIFFKAVREVYQSYVVFPNVAISAVIDFENVKEALDTDERRFFFMGLIDCVVIDSENNYKPIKFVELDSVFHDTDKQQKNDKMKDKIISKAGHRLFRVRADNREITEDNFKILIREVIR